MKISQLDKSNFYFVSLETESYDFEDYNLYHPLDEGQDLVKYYAERTKIVSASIGYINGKNLVVKTFSGEESKVLIKLRASMEAFEGRKLAGWGVASNIIPFIIKRSLINLLEVPSSLDFGDIAPWSKDFLDVQKIWGFGSINNPSIEEVHKALVPIPLEIKKELQPIYMVAEIFLRITEGCFIENVEERYEETKTS